MTTACTYATTICNRKKKEIRETTNRLIELAEDRVISWEVIARTALNWLSEDDVDQMARVNDFLPDEEDEEDAADND